VHAPTPFAIEAHGLIKDFGATRAVDDLDLQVPTGQVYGVLGPNGAGKTTAVRLLATLLRPDAGRASVLGHDLATADHEIRARVSLTGQFASVDEDLTGRENLVLLARLLGYGRSDARGRAEELLAAFDLVDAGGRQVKRYSGGMRRRIDIAASIVSTPELIFLDEPTTGLDPRSRNQVWEIIRALVAAGTTVVLTTQYLEEADQLADRIAIIERGRVIAEGTAAELKSSVGSGTLHVRVREPQQRPHAEALLAGSLAADVHLETDPVALSARVSDPDRVAHALAELAHAGVAVSDFHLGQPSLDEVFLALTGHPAANGHAPTEESPR
jgi:ABC-2 type transport system ATP-binding protein